MTLYEHWRSPRLWLRLTIAFGALVAIMGAVVMLAVMQFRDLARHGEQTMRTSMQRMLQVQQIDQHVHGHGRAMALLLTSPRSEREHIYPMVDAEYAAIERLTDELFRHTPDTAAAMRLQNVTERRNQYRSVFIDIVTEIESGDTAAASHMFQSTGQAALRSLLEASQVLLRHEKAALKARQSEVQAQIGRSEWLLAALAMAAVCVSIVLAWRTTLSVVRPLRRVETVAGRIAGGDYSARVNVRSGDELGRVAQAMNAMAEAIAEREAQIETVAYRDYLTDLPNRTLLRRVAAARDDAKLSLMLMDVARLSTVNEVLGFETGDELLVQIAERLRSAVEKERQNEGEITIARMPGGTFAVLCQGLSLQAVEALRGRLDAQLCASLQYRGHSVDIHLVYGLASAADEPGLTIEDLIRRAELAIGQAKRQQLPWAWHAPADDVARASHLSLLSNLRHAAATGELEMWLQPKQCLRTNQILGFEGLVRWRHPERGYISPAEFIPFAEQTGHIGVVTTAMLDTALQRLAAWTPSYPDLSIAVNVSALDVRDTSFPGRIEQIARRHGAPLYRLRLEITESSVMENTEKVLPILHQLRELGVQLSIDDFGTGYSSLAQLHRLPVCELKIDRSFVAGAERQPESRALLRTIIELGHSLEMCVTAEGVERPEERDLLAELGCNVAQGYLIAKPMAPETVGGYIDDQFGKAASVATA